MACTPIAVSRCVFVTALAFATGCAGAPPARATVEADVRAVAEPFAAARDRHDLAAMKKLATRDAQSFFDVLLEIEDRDVEEPAPPGPGFELMSISFEDRGDVARARFAVPDSEAGEGMTKRVAGRNGDPAERDFEIHLRRETDVWRVFGVASEIGDAPRVYARSLTAARDRLAALRRTQVPHEKLGALVEAYFAAIQTKNRTALAGLMTKECVVAEMTKGRDKAFTGGFLAGRFSVHKRRFFNHRIDGDRGVQRVRTLLRSGDELDKEPMRFEFVRGALGWRISAIR